MQYEQGIAAYGDRTIFDADQMFDAAKVNSAFYNEPKKNIIRNRNHGAGSFYNFRLSMRLYARSEPQHGTIPNGRQTADIAYVQFLVDIERAPVAPKTTEGELHVSHIGSSDPIDVDCGHTGS